MEDILKTLLITLNAKYIHTSLALRWLYVANKNNYDIDFREYTIKDKLDDILVDIIDEIVISRNWCLHMECKTNKGISDKIKNKTGIL